MSIKNVFFQWNSVATKYHDFHSYNLNDKDCTFYTSFLLNNEQYNLGDYVFAKVEKEDIIGRLLCIYESHEDYEEHEQYRGIIRLYRRPPELGFAAKKRFLKNEIIEDDAQDDIFLTDIKAKCTPVIGTPEDNFEEFPSSYCKLRYKILNSSLVPVLSDEAIECTTVLNQFEKVSTPKNTGSGFTASANNISRTPYLTLFDSMKKTQQLEVFSPSRRKFSVKRNLNESFDSAPNSQEGTPVLNYSLIENTAVTNDSKIKLKFRRSQRQSLTISLDRLDADVLNKYLTKDKDCDKINSNVEAVEKKKNSKTSDTKESTLVVRRSVRRSTRTKQRISYADFESPEGTPSKRNTMTISDDSSSSSHSIPPKAVSKKETEHNLAKRRNRERQNASDGELSPKKISKTSTITRQSRREHIPPRTVDKISPRKRKIYTPSKYADYVSSPMTTTRRSILKQNNKASSPTKLVCYVDDSDSSSNELSPRKKRNIEQTVRTQKKSITYHTSTTPKQEHCTTTPTSAVKCTPSSRAKLVREGLLTPSVQCRATPAKAGNTPLNMAKTKLHVSYVPKVLACREKEFNDIYNFIEGKLFDGCGGCMYVSGVPGTGKTATATEVVKKLQAQIKSRKIPEFQYVVINGMKLSEPRQSYVEILKQLNAKTMRWEQAQSMLDTKFTKTGNKGKPIVLLVDELDILCTKRQDVVYNLLDWPTKAKAQLIVITIANTMDLPERLLMGRVTSRLGLTRLTFQAYTHKQLQEIVTKRLSGTDAFNTDAVQLVARKVASVSGDARRALDICRRAAEIAELEGDDTLVSMNHVNEAISAMITQPKVLAIKHCSRLQQLTLQAVVAEVERTGVEETTFSDVFTMLISIAALDGFQMVSCTVVLRAISRLGACRLLLTEQKSDDFNQKIILNVSSDDVYYALKKDY